MSDVRRIAIETSPGMLDDDAFSIVDLDVQDQVNLLSELAAIIVYELGEKKFEDLFEDPRIMAIYNSGELGWYDNYERAKEVFDEIQQAIISGKIFYEMSEE
ncbi:MAG TPA: hypothetical protein DDW65_00950 [Firmicutes bacterium]|nr:hypothetical protein [Bacillota bacterium]